MCPAAISRWMARATYIAQVQEFGVAMNGRHEARAFFIDEDRAFAAQRFGGKRCGIAASMAMAVGWNCTEFWIGDQGAPRAQPCPNLRHAPQAGLVVTAKSAPSAAGGEDDGGRAEQNETCVLDLHPVARQITR